MRYVLIPCLLAAASACGPRTPPAAAAGVTAAIETVGAPDQIRALNDAAHRHRGESASLAVHLAHPDSRVRWAAAYIGALWADDEADIAALAPHLDDSDPAIRAVIAGSLAGLGHRGSRQVLGALVDSTATMPFSDPPLTVGRFASAALADIARAEPVVR